jgi:hypothetical protein
MRTGNMIARPSFLWSRSRYARLAPERRALALIALARRSPLNVLL